MRNYLKGENLITNLIFTWCFIVSHKCLIDIFIQISNSLILNVLYLILLICIVNNRHFYFQYSVFRYKDLPLN